MNMVLKISILQKFRSQADFLEVLSRKMKKRIPESRLSRIIHRRYVARAEERQAIAKILDIPEDELFGKAYIAEPWEITAREAYS